MATNTEFMKIMVKDAEMLWPRLDQPYRYNAQEKKSEACPATATNAGYSIAWVMTSDEAKGLFQTLRTHYNAQRELNRKLPEFKQVFGMKKLEDGTVHFTAKKRAVSGQGKLNKPPVVVGPDLKDLADKAIWSGSRGNIRVQAFPTTDPDGAGGVSLLLDAVQVVEAKYGGDGLEGDFEIVEADSASGFAAMDADAAVETKKTELADAEW